jgi:hypothetical protein
LPRFAKNFLTAGFIGLGLALDVSAMLLQRKSAAMPKQTASRQSTVREMVFAAVTAEIPCYFARWPGQGAGASPGKGSPG